MRTGAWLNALMGGLPHHSAHHAFPWIPSARLPLASHRIAAVLQRHGAAAMPQIASYGHALGWLWRGAPGATGARLVRSSVVTLKGGHERERISGHS